MRFEWQTAEDERLSDGPPPADGGGSTGRPRWLPFLLLGLVLAAALYLGYRRWERHAAQTAATVRADVLATHRLVQQAAGRGDRELFHSLLSGRDVLWAQAQEDLVAGRLLFDRRNAGLFLQPDESPAYEAIVSADLNEVEVQASHVYTTVAPAGHHERVRLRQTSLYRLGRSGWLYSPPAESFWGPPVVSRGRYLTLRVAKRDELIGNRLATDLESLLATLCNPPAGYPCPADFHFDLSLVTDPASLASLANGPPLFDGLSFRPRSCPAGASADCPLLPGLLYLGQAAGRAATYAMALPTPTLIGLPVDERASAALYRLYGRSVARSLIPPLVGVACCRQRLIFQALLDWDLSQRQLTSWPLALADFHPLEANPISLEQMGVYWADTPPAAADMMDWRPAYALVEFVARFAAEVPPAAMIALLDDQPSAIGWLRAIVPSVPSQRALDQEWLHFVLGKIAAVEFRPLVAAPAQDLLAICRFSPADLPTLYRFAAADSAWRQELPERDLYAIAALPDGSGVLLLEQDPGGGDRFLSRVVLWRNGRETTLTSGDGYYFFTGAADPAGRRLAMLGIDSQGHHAAAILDLDNCGPTGCAVTPTRGLPVWSPDGRHTLVAEGATYTGASSTAQPAIIFRGDENGQPIVGVDAYGAHPFWIDSHTYGYLRQLPQPALVTGDVRDNQNQVRLARPALGEAVPGSNSPPFLFFLHALPNPAEPGQVFVGAVHVDQPSYYLFVHDLATGQTTFLSQLDLLPQASLQLSPGGRWLLLSSNHPRAFDGRPERRQILYDVQTGSFTHFVFDPSFVLPIEEWSNDGRWLARLGQGFLLLSAPAEGHHEAIAHDFFDCSGLAWVNR